MTRLREIRRPWLRQPTGLLRPASWLPPEVHVTFPIGQSWVNATTGLVASTTRGYFDIEPGPTGTQWSGNTSSKNIDLGVPSGPIYGLLLEFTLTVADLTSSSTSYGLLVSTADVSSSSQSIALGNSTGYLTGETLCIYDGSTETRTGTSDSISKGFHRLIVQYDAATARYVFVLDGKTMTALSTATQSALQTFKPYLTPRNYSGDPRFLVSLAVINQSPTFDLRSVIGNPWPLLEPQRIFVPMSSGAPSVPTLSAATYMPGSITSSGFRPRVTAS